MEKLTRDEFNAIKNEIYSDLIIDNVMADTDTNFMYLDSVLGRHLNVDWLAEDDGKIKLKAITIHWAEGDNSKYDKFPQSYSSYVATNKALIPIYEDILSSGYGGYNKVRFTLLFEDNETYEGKLFISDKVDNPTLTDNVIGEHIKDHLNWVIEEDAIADTTEVKNLLNKYSLC